MKSKFYKKAVSVVLVLAMALSVCAVSLITASASTYENYTVNCCTTDAGTSSSEIYICVYGTSGSTGWYNIGEIGNDSTGSAQFNAKSVGQITKIELDHILELQNPCNPTTVTIKNSENDVTFYNSETIGSDEPLTLSVTDKAFRLDIKTGSVDGAGTDAYVYINFVDEDGDSYKTEISMLHPKSNAFEAKDEASIIVKVPDNIDTLDYIEISVDGDIWFNLKADWYLDTINITHIAGDHKDTTYSCSVYKWIYNGEEPLKLEL